MVKNPKKLIIIDGNALVHRAFHALPPLSDKDGRPTNAVYGFTAILLKALKDLKPDYLAACFDLRAKTFRHEQYREYKATRVKQPQELYDQIPLIKDVLQAFNIPVFEQAGFEADDLIATIAQLKSVDRPDIETIIMTGDQDTLQLVDDNTKVLSPRQGLSETTLYGEKEIKEKFNGLTPKQLVDYKALAGDQSDNIPGVKGIGRVGAIKLLNDFGDLENLYRHLASPEIKDRTKQLLQEQKQQALMSKELVKLIKDVPINFHLEDCRFSGFNKHRVAELFQQLNFKRLMSQLSALDDQKIKITGGQIGLFEKDKSPEKTSDRQAAANTKNSKDYQLINDPKQLKAFVEQLKKQKFFAFDTETDNLDPFQAKLLGISFSWEKNRAYYLTAEMVTAAPDVLAKIFADAKIKKVGHNLKFDLEVLNQSGLAVNGLFFDTMIASYLLNPGNRQHNLETLAFVELGYEMQPIADLIGQGRQATSLAEVPTEKVSWYSGEDAEITWQLYQKLSQELGSQGMSGLLEDLEMPLVAVLYQIEKNGVKLDAALLKKLSKKLGERIGQTEKKIYRLAGQKFNPASPLQLKEILFERLKIPTQGLGKTKTGISTAAGELEKLQDRHPIIKLILEFRELSKLKNTYTDALPKLINPRDHRLHTSFNQTVAATGRLSSSDPNLQNIPIRGETGREIRRAFIAEPGYKILKADYSQIELRIVASLANDPKMLKIFRDGGDIHTATAAAIHNLDPKKVTPDIRRTAKEVNFGVLYGMGAWGLAQRTGISQIEAQKFISKYFDTFSQVRKWLNETVELAEERGYVETLYGRRRYLPEINSGIGQVKNAAERMAVNMPVQGTAADLIKLAMVAINKDLAQVSPQGKMILQVHDELVFEAPEKDLKKLARFVQEKMCSVMKLRAPIEVEVSVGDNWGETEKIKI